MARQRKISTQVIAPGPRTYEKRLEEKHGVILDHDDRTAYISTPTQYWIFRRRLLGGNLKPIRRFQLVNRDRDEAIHLEAPASEQAPWSGPQAVTAKHRFELEEVFGRAEQARLEQKQPADRMFMAIAIAIVLPVILMTIKIALRGFGPPEAG